MDPTLPRPVSLRLDQALGQWRRWSTPPDREPEFLAPMPRGHTNTTVFVTDGQRQWVVRIDGFDPHRLGLSRSVEWRVLYKAAAAGLSPQPVYANPDIGVLICEYLEPDPEPVADLEAVAALLRNIHALPPVRFHMDPEQRARRYLHLSDGGDISEKLLEACKEIDAMPPVQCLCHNDLLLANRLEHGGKVYALDWEYAAMGDPWFDLAAVIEGDGLSDDQAETLHAAWLQRAPDAAELRRLDLNRRIYWELSALWADAMKALEEFAGQA